MPVMMLAGIESGSETAASLSAHYRRRRALFDPGCVKTRSGRIDDFP